MRWLTDEDDDDDNLGSLVHTCIHMLSNNDNDNDNIHAAYPLANTTDSTPCS